MKLTSEFYELDTTIRLDSKLQFSMGINRDFFIGGDNALLSEINKELEANINKKLLMEFDSNGNKNFTEDCNDFQNYAKNYEYLIVNPVVASRLTELPKFKTIITDMQMGMIYPFGSIGSCKILVNPYFSWNETKSYFLNKVKYNISDIEIKDHQTPDMMPRSLVNFEFGIKSPNFLNLTLICEVTNSDIKSDYISHKRRKNISKIIDKK